MLTVSSAPSQNIPGFPEREPAMARQSRMSQCPFTCWSVFVPISQFSSISSENRSCTIHLLTIITVTTMASIDPLETYVPSNI